MEPTMHTSSNATDGGNRQSLRAAIALTICGAIGGASILEAITSAWLHPASSALAAQPTAEPVALVGAVIGAAATVVIQHRMKTRASLLPSASHAATPFEAHDFDSHDFDTALDIAPLTPMAWQPVPPTRALDRAGDAVDILAWSEPTICQIGSRPHSHERSLRHGGRQTYRRTQTPRRVSAQG